MQPGTPAEQAGLRAGDAIESVDGHAFHTVSTLLAYMQYGQGKPVSLVVLRNGATLHMVAHPAKLDASGCKLGFAAVPIPFRDDPLPLGDGCDQVDRVLRRQLLPDCRSAAADLYPQGLGLAALRAGGHCAHGRRCGGDEGLAARSSGWPAKSASTWASSTCCPFPILDGGMILLLLIESVLRRDISINVKERIYQAAFVVLVAFFAFIIFNDVTKLPVFTHLKP